jgi:hypothetical protein
LISGEKKTVTEEKTEHSLAQEIIRIIKEENPETVDRLIERIIEQNPGISRQKILQAVTKLQDQDKLKLTSTTSLTPQISSYLRTSQATWYWITLILTALSIICIFTIPENAYPIVIMRYILGAIFVLWLPGYTLIKALFPNTLPFKTSDKNLDTIERIALSSGMSLALVPIIGLLLNYTPWGIRLTPITLSLTASTLIFATAALIRENQARPKTLNVSSEALQFEARTPQVS